MLIFDRFYRKTVLPQPNGGFFKETELRGFVLGPVKNYAQIYMQAPAE